VAAEDRKIDTELTAEERQDLEALIDLAQRRLAGKNKAK